MAIKVRQAVFAGMLGILCWMEAPGQQPAASSPVASWRMEAITAGQVPDDQSGKYPLQVVGNAQVVTGADGIKAIQLKPVAVAPGEKPTDSRLVVPKALASQFSDAYTLSLKLTLARTNVNSYTVFPFWAKGAYWATGSALGVRYGTLSFVRGKEPLATDTPKLAEQPQWFHVVYAVDRTGGSLWVDGKKVADVDPAKLARHVPMAFDLEMSFGTWFAGAMRDAALFNRRLADEEIAGLFHARARVDAGPVDGQM